MCSVVGYIGKNYCRSYILDALSRLEYRGYDSAGLVFLHPKNKNLVYSKTQGGVDNLLKNIEKFPIDGYVGLGHTRWSTHGIDSTENAHPHFDCSGDIAITHNGIIENYKKLKDLLIKEGHEIVSQTDTEIVAHLAESALSGNNLVKGIVSLVRMLEGAYAIALLVKKYPEKIILIRKRSPLCIGFGDDEMFIASDTFAFSGKAKKVLFLPDESFALVSNKSAELYDFNGNSLPLDFKIINSTSKMNDKGGYEHYMLKEIYEQKRVIQDTVKNYKNLGNNIWMQMGLTKKSVVNLNSLKLVGCGTSYHAALIAKFFFEKISQVSTQAYLASEFRHLPIFNEDYSLAMGISQSGETADTLEGMRFLNENSVDTVAITNIVDSTIVRESNGYLLTYAGREISVASTKAFTAQLASLYWLAHRIALEKKLIDSEQMELAENNLLITAELLENSIDTYKKEIIDKLAKIYSKFDKAIFLGRYISFPFAKEVALKFKEIPYIFADTCPSGELKHGSLALIDKNLPVFIFSTNDPVAYQKLVSNAQEVKARSGEFIAFCFEGQDELIELANQAFIFPSVKPLLEPLVMAGLAQFLIYQIAKVLNRPIDKPRNLAKSVTVE